MTDEQRLRCNCAFQLGLERHFKQAGISGQRLHAMIDLTAKIAGQEPDNQQLEGLLREAVSAYYTDEEPNMTSTHKTAEEKQAQAEKQADAFEYGIGLTIKQAGITDPHDVQAFLGFAAELAADESEQ